MKPTYEELAVQLANAESKCRELTAENAGLKNPENWLSQSDYGYEASEVATQNGATEDESLRATALYPVHTEFQHSVLNLYAMASERSDFLSGLMRKDRK
ncbi:hypothetical protein ACNY92_004486 [Citrobacter freundii]